MDVEYHPEVRKDIRDIVAYYDEEGGSAADRFIQELREFVTV